MCETAGDLLELADLLDRGQARAGDHLRRISTPERRTPASKPVALRPGVQVLDLATVGRARDPRRFGRQPRPPGAVLVRRRLARGPCHAPAQAPRPASG